MRPLLLGVTIAILTLVSTFVWLTISILPKSGLASFKTFEIPPGQTVSQISLRLKNEGLIKNALAFRILVAISGLSGKIQAGSYQLSPSWTAGQIARNLTLGTFDVWLTIPEGWRIEEIADELNSKLAIDRSEFIKSSREGYMFPDTYRIPTKATPVEIAKIMIDNFNQRLDENLRQQAASSGLNLKTLIILASIVEREVKFEQDLKIVAGILLKRWQNQLPLEADATVQYAVGFQPQDKIWWKKNLTKEDLQIDSPYNTRKFAQLPPGPICNPGLAAIKAVITPSETDYFYYISDKQGRMHYATTLDQHIENIKNYF